ncbi:hypothetical protein JXA12_05790 [Candidatus Woesearchaeota archaeon]|nr:hypothetical protein [Candidatus Woesearchaeota archaeon]
MLTEDIALYQELLDLCGDITQYTENTQTFHSQMSWTPLNEKCNHTILPLSEVVPRQSLFPKIPELEQECKECWKFYLSPRNKSIRVLDIQLGRKFEFKLIEFLKRKGIDCRKGDEEDKRFPDNVVYTDGKKSAYLEIKYQSAPWLWAYREEGSNRECYEGSPALDIKKLKQQYELIKSGAITIPSYYVYWLDFPCIKGVFFISIEDMYKFFEEEAILFDRKEREGDFKTINGVKKKVSATIKIHPSLFRMKSFSQLLEVLI